MRFKIYESFFRSFDWHDWFAWHPIHNPEGDARSWLWLETVERKRIEVGNQGLTGNYEWRYRIKSPPQKVQE